MEEDEGPPQCVSEGPAEGACELDRAAGGQSGRRVTAITTILVRQEGAAPGGQGGDHEECP